MLHRGEAAALLVGHVGQGAHGFDRAVLDLHDGIDVAVAEMHTHTGFKATGSAEGIARVDVLIGLTPVG